MKQVFTRKATRVALVGVVAAILAPAAHAKGGAVSHVYAPPPLDAGSAVANPDYVQPARHGAVRPDDRASRGSVHGIQASTVVVSSSGDGFDWGDASIGAAGVFVVALLGAGSAVVLRRNRHRAASA
jgi:hypothetical protein